MSRGIIQHCTREQRDVFTSSTLVNSLHSSVKCLNNLPWLIWCFREPGTHFPMNLRACLGVLSAGESE